MKTPHLLVGSFPWSRCKARECYACACYGYRFRGGKTPSRAISTRTSCYESRSKIKGVKWRASSAPLRMPSQSARLHPALAALTGRGMSRALKQGTDSPGDPDPGSRFGPPGFFHARSRPKSSASFAPFLIAAKPEKPCDGGVFRPLNLLSKKEWNTPVSGSCLTHV